MLSTEISEFLAEFRPRTHAVVFYHSREKKRDLLFGHLKYGAENNAGLAYVCSEETPLQIQIGMKEFGIDVEGLKMRNRLTINNYNRIYIVDGKVDVPSIIDAFGDLSKKYSSMGLKGMRASAEMSCFLKEQKVKEMIMYEYALHRKFDFPAEGICGYNIFDLSNAGCLEMIMPLVRAHDPEILTGPKECLLLEPDKVEDKDVEETMKIKL